MARPIFSALADFLLTRGGFPASTAGLLPTVGISSHSNEFEFPEKYCDFQYDSDAFKNDSGQK